MLREGKKIDDLGIAIGELLGIPAIQRELAPEDQASASKALITMEEVEPADRIEHVLNDRSVQALFDAIPAKT